MPHLKDELQAVGRLQVCLILAVPGKEDVLEKEVGLHGVVGAHAFIREADIVEVGPRLMHLYVPRLGRGDLHCVDVLRREVAE